MTPFERLLQSNGFRSTKGIWARDNLVAAGLARMSVREATELDRRRITPVGNALNQDYVVVIEVGEQRIEQLRNQDQVLDVMAIFLTG